MEALQSQQILDNKETQPLSTRSDHLLLPHMPLQFDDISSPARQRVEQYITACFYRSYQAKITDFLPYLLSTHSHDKLTATIGFQPAATKQPLFLEQYTTQKIELEIGDLVSQTVERNQIVEIGNLTSCHYGKASQVLFILTVAILHQAGFKWVTFTATKQVQSLLKKLNLITIEICSAGPENLTDKGAVWGHYYDDVPTVLAGNLTAAMTQLNKHKVIRFLLSSYHNNIIVIAHQLKEP
ncbi:MAG: hemolysin [Methylophaga sp.]|nr:MAG: hemolysin [Methylophaga sp.]